MKFNLLTTKEAFGVSKLLLPHIAEKLAKWVLEVASRWFPKQPQPPKTVPLKSTFKGWGANGPTTEEVTKAEVQHDQKNDEIGETQLDSQTQQDVDVGDGQQKRGAEAPSETCC